MTTEEIGTFKAFLVKKRLWSEFKREYYKKGNNPSLNINTTLKQVDKRGVIAGTITWCLSSRGYDEGIDFWGKVSDEWQELIESE